MKIKIDKVLRYTRNKQGEPYKTKEGKPFTRVAINSGEKWFTAFDFGAGWTDGWQDGDEIEVEVEEKEYKGETQYNIKKPDTKRQAYNMSQDMKSLQERVKKLEEVVFPKKKKKKENEDIDPDDLPF